MEDKGEVLYELGPKFNFFYELTMPTGRKLKSALTAVIISIVLYVILFLCKGYIVGLENETMSSIYNIANIVCIVAIIITIIMLISRISMQIMEYKGISYKFYKDCMVYENDFLSQTKKTIEYSNIREVEIRRTVTDRVMNYGVIIIYTNADRARGSATILYGIKNTEEHYNNIESLIHNGNIISTPIKTENPASDLKTETDLKNAMTRNETYTEYNATSDKDPLDKE